MSLNDVILAVNNLSVEEIEPCVLEDNIMGQYFFAEERIWSPKLRVTVEGVGKLNFPLEQNILRQLLRISSPSPILTLRAGGGNRIKRDCKISVDMLKVEWETPAFSEVLSNIAAQLKLDENCKLVPHLHNMLIHTGGSLYKEHKVTEDIDKMIITLVLVLPSFCTEGTLVVTHLSSSKSFNCSSDLSGIKCIAFYSDCSCHVAAVGKDSPVVLLTYNIEIKGPSKLNPIDVTRVDEPLNAAVARYFNTDKQPKQLALCLTHSYSQTGLNWNKLKGYDRIVTRAMFAVSKKQKLTPYLALAEGKETWKFSGINGKLTEKFVNLYYWLNEYNMHCDRPKQFDFHALNKEAINAFVGYKPYQSKRTDDFGYLQRRIEQWYRLSYIVLVKEDK